MLHSLFCDDVLPIARLGPRAVALSPQRSTLGRAHASIAPLCLGKGRPRATNVHFGVGDRLYIGRGMWYNAAMQAISLDNVTYRYKTDEGPLVAVDNLSLTIEEGSFVVVLGANGSGKSTLAKMLNGLLTPTKGKVTVYGDDTLTEQDEVIFRIRSLVGMVFQNPDNQMVASIIEDDVAFGPENLGVPHDEMVQRVEWALGAVDMLAYRRHTPQKLSGGQKQRVAIAAVLAMRPKVLVLDESTAMLDPQGRAEVMQVLHRLNHDNGITVVHITHHMEECVDADRALVMSHGHLVYDGTPIDLFGHTKLTAWGLELPPVVQMVALLNEAGLDLDPSICHLQQLEEALCRLS